MKAVLSQETARRCKNHNTYQITKFTLVKTGQLF